MVLIHLALDYALMALKIAELVLEIFAWSSKRKVNSKVEMHLFQECGTYVKSYLAQWSHKLWIRIHQNQNWKLQKQAEKMILLKLVLQPLKKL